MITLNRPFKSSYRSSLTPHLDFEAWNEAHFGGYTARVLFASRDGLGAVYKHLRETRGQLRVAVSPLTCFIALYPLVANGHTPVFVDVNPDTFNMDEAELEKLENIDAVQVIHLGGNPCNMEAISRWAKERNAIVIEDCAQALGSTFAGKQVGSWGNYSVFSLVKGLNAAVGGLLLEASLTPPKEGLFPPFGGIKGGLGLAYKRLKRWLESRTSSCGTNPANWLYYALLSLKERGEDSLPVGVNLRSLSEVEGQSALADFCFLDSLNEKRRAVADAIIGGVSGRFQAQQVLPEAVSNRNRLLFRSSGAEAQTIIAELRKRGIAANNLTQSYLHGYQPHILQDKTLKTFYTQHLPNYEKLFPMFFAVPCSPSLTKREIDWIVRAVNDLEC